MLSILSKTWILFFGYAIICLGHGLQGTLVGVRAVLEDFSFISAGIIITGYYIGYLLGSLIIPILLKKVGHIRVFAALASLASIAILMHSVFIDPYIWCLIRVFTGISIAGIFVIMESWLNEKSTNETRGSLLSVYMIITFVLSSSGQVIKTSTFSPTHYLKADVSAAGHFGSSGVWMSGGLGVEELRTGRLRTG